MTRFSRFWLLFIGILFMVQPVLAQNGGKIVLQPPDTSHFPSVSLTFEAYDAQGGFIGDLSQNELQVSENSQMVAADSLARLQPGMHIIVSFNAAPSMGTAVGAGPNRFDQVKKTMLAWMQGQAGNSPDELSLVTNAGPQATRLSGPALWGDALSAYTPDLAKTQPSLTSLTTALDLASDPSRKANSKRAILYITAPLPDNNLAALANLAERAGQLGVRISVWLLPPTGSDGRSAKALSAMALQTGGQFFSYSGVETLPNPESYFQPLRFVYRLTYSSAIWQTGTQRVQLALQRRGMQAQAEQRFIVNLQPPNPIFLSPPVRIQRSWSKSEESGKSVLTPVSINIQTIVEFPDGLRRALKAIRLFVDGQKVDEVTSEPFNPLVWQLSGYSTSGKHALRVEIEDSLGFTQASIETPIEVQVDAALAFDPGAIVEVTQKYLPYAGLGVVGILLSALGWVGLRAIRRRLSADRPVPTRKNALPRTRIAVPQPAPARLHANHNAPARLTRVAESPFSLARPSFALDREVMHLGSEARGVEILIEAATVDAVHACITRSAEGRYIIQDSGSIAGTWVNYVLALPNGTLLEHGDQIHLGREVFRFELKNPPAPRQPKVTSLIEES